MQAAEVLNSTGEVLKGIDEELARTAEALKGTSEVSKGIDGALV